MRIEDNGWSSAVLLNVQHALFLLPNYIGALRMQISCTTLRVPATWKYDSGKVIVSRSAAGMDQLVSHLTF